jgi:hypothetical protein
MYSFVAGSKSGDESADAGNCQLEASKVSGVEADLLP